MTFDLMAMVVAALLAVPFSWMLPAVRSADGVAVWTFLVLAMLSPFTAAWLGFTSILLPLFMSVGDRFGGRGLITLFWCLFLTAALFFSRIQDWFLLIGAAYFTLRLLHVQLDWWMGRQDRPDFLAHLRYQFFLPVLMTGPINRFSDFTRQLDRRRWDSADFFAGAERALLGLAQATVLGSWIMGKVDDRLTSLASTDGGGLWLWAHSAADWVQLYLTFAGFSSFAIGVALMMGIRIEENFNRPWQARNLIEFWSRWHMTLSSWCRDYVFQPVAALTRMPVLGVLAAMTAIGLWHDTTLYYLLWALWQALGIVVSHLISRLPWPGRDTPMLNVATAIAGPLFVAAWLTATRPVVTFVLGAF